MTSSWFGAWEVIPWGIGGDAVALRCPRADDNRPDRTPECFIPLSGPKSITTLKEIAVEHHLRIGH